MPETETALIQKHIEPTPHQPGPGDVRIVGTGIPVWALVAYQRAAHSDLALVAVDYALPIEAVEAAMAYYEQHRAALDAHLEANEAA